MLAIPKVKIVLEDGITQRHWAPRGGTTYIVRDTDGTDLEVAVDLSNGLSYILDSDGVTKLYLSTVAAVYSMNLTTLARVKASLGGLSSTQHDTTLTNIIESVSSRFERFMRRQVLERSLTETVPLAQFSTTYSLDTYPVTAITSIKYVSHPSDSATATALDATSYVLEDPSSGLVRFLFDATRRSNRLPGYLVIAYTGGMAEDTADFVATYPDIAHAAELQAAYEFQRRNAPGGNATGSTSSTAYTGDMDLLPAVKTVLYGHRREML